jgi:hypothetical protein
VVTKNFPQFVENKNKINEKTFLRVILSCHIFVIDIIRGKILHFFAFNVVFGHNVFTEFLVNVGHCTLTKQMDHWL